MVRYMRRRGEGANALAEASAMFLLPQLEGLDAAPALEVYRAVNRALHGSCSSQQLQELKQRFDDVFPQMTFTAT
jgi:hypothetical protein